MREFAGDFETHLTVSPGGGHERLESWAGRRGLKYARIVLDRGQAPDQPMLTVRGRGTLTAQRDAARAWVAEMAEAGFAVTRLKIEASPFNADVPQTAAEAAALPPGCYFEHHVKLVLTGPEQVDRARAISERHAAHLSRNARRVLTDGSHHRFVTQRCRDVGLPEARRRLDALLAALTADGFAALEAEAEFVVVDDNPDLDAGWIDERAAA
ncbi:hypothetical protein QEZ54_29915 [Catellatospora sp. KI3]|uniref:hypothetical protein n=1 Tax=Catellatospora sp. KI3 TaxID=3041620 RepID=UPI002482D758|nr:hypothetical protein [Catellatospora sp. KI3]MDI1465194.1 hypothetical protein [Catellatospora sp. KI3]